MRMSPPAAPVVEVVQADLDRAAEFYADSWFRTADAESHHCVQMLARHRLAALRDPAEVEGDDHGDATVLRAHCRIHGETPSMTHSSREHWKARALAAEAVLATTPPHTQAAELAEALRGTLWIINEMQESHGDRLIPSEQAMVDDYAAILARFKEQSA